MKKVFCSLLIVAMFASLMIPALIVAQTTPQVWVVRGPPPGVGPEPSPQEIPWGIERIYAPDAWATTNGSGVQIAVLDTGVDKDHEDLWANIAWGISVVGDKESTIYRDWKDKNGHGTHVTGTIAALYNDIGVVGVGPEIEIYAIKVISDAGFGTWTDLAEGIEWAIKGPDGTVGTDDDAEVISMSLGGTAKSDEVEAACQKAYDLDIVLVAAAGNEGDDGVLYPAKFSTVIAVGATAEDDSVPSWSSKGPEVELGAPGVNVLSTVPRDRYESYSGTSMACPHVSGTVGLMIAKIIVEGRTYNVTYIRTILHDTAEDIGQPPEAVGYGLVRADKAVAAA